MKIAVVGSGILGLTLSYRLSALGHDVHLFESSPDLGGLCASYNYGHFIWDKFYHCITPQDQELIGLINELGLSDELRWTTTRTAFFYDGIFHSMSSNLDFLRFNVLSTVDKLRLAAGVIRMRTLHEKEDLQQITACSWLTKIFGSSNYEFFWQPLLMAKFGSFYGDVSAAFLRSTILRSFQARKSNGKEILGHLRGGYHTFLQRIQRIFKEKNIRIFLKTDVVKIEGDPLAQFCTVTFLEQGRPEQARFDRVYYTGPASEARKIVDGRLLPIVEKIILSYPSSRHYMGVVCVTHVLTKPLTPYYLVNIKDAGSVLTGYVELNNLADRNENFNGRALVYLPRYVSSDDPLFETEASDIEKMFADKGLRRLFPSLKSDQILSSVVQRARYVQAIPLAGEKSLPESGAPVRMKPFQILNSSMLKPSHLFNNAVIRFVNNFIEANQTDL